MALHINASPVDTSSKIKMKTNFQKVKAELNGRYDDSTEAYVDFDLPSNYSGLNDAEKKQLDEEYISLENYRKIFDENSLEYHNAGIQWYINQAGGIGTGKAVAAAATYLYDHEYVPYFWGGKQYGSTPGFNMEWGKMYVMESPGSDKQKQGEQYPYGLDCSGFTHWAMITAGFNSSAISTEDYPPIATSHPFTADTLYSGSIEPGDFLYHDGHIAIVTNIDFENNEITVIEEKGADEGMIKTVASFDDYCTRTRTVETAEGTMELPLFDCFLSMKDYYNNPNNLNTNYSLGLPDMNLTIQKSVQPKAVGQDDEQTAMRKIFYAIETGGQVYGNADYESIIGAGTNTANETAITIGAGQWNGAEAKNLLLRIKEADPENFAKLDTANISDDLNGSWENYNPAEGSDKWNTIKTIISSNVGISVQDQLMDEEINGYLDNALSHGITDLGGQVMYAEIMHCGGESAAERILNHAEEPYTTDSLYQAVTSSWPDDAGKNAPINSDMFRSRHDFVYENIKQQNLEGNASQPRQIASEETISPVKDVAPIVNQETPETVHTPTLETHTKQPDISNDSDVSYTVQSGDTLSRISSSHDTTQQKIVDANEIIKDPDYIEVGWTLNIPQSDSTNISTSSSTTYGASGTSNEYTTSYPSEK